MPHKPLEYITKMYHIKMRRLETKSRKGVEKELSKDSRLFACTSSYAIKEGKKFRAKTSLEELFFFFFKWIKMGLYQIIIANILFIHLKK